MNPTLALANAGCGKTYLLANVLIKLLAEHLHRDEKPEPTMTLAVTFTRAAAAEMSRRLLKHLAEGTLDDAARGRFSDQTGAMTAANFATLLAAVTQALPRLQLGTIDSLIGRIAGAFPAECGLPEGWEYIDDDEIPAIVRRCIIEWAAQEPSAFRDALAALSQGRSPAQPLSAMLALVGGSPSFGRRASAGALLDFWQAPSEAAWDWMERCPLKQLCPGANRLTASSFDEWREKLGKAALPPTAKGGIDKRWNDAHLTATLALASPAADWVALATGGLIQRVGETGRYYNKDAPPDLLAACQALFAHALAMVVEQLQTQGGARFRALTSIATRLNQQQFALGRYTFSDITRAVDRAFTSGDWRLDQMHYRLDSQIRDMALDEFQDTSAEQYGILRPLIDEMLSGEGAHGQRGLLVVTDPKQSIYGWRGGRPDLINQLPTMEHKQLARSFRSSPAICGFVNRVFTGQTAAGAPDAEACSKHLTRVIITERGWDSDATGMRAALESCGRHSDQDHDTPPLARGIAQWSEHFMEHVSAQPADGGLLRIQRVEHKSDIAAAVVELVRERLARRPGKSIGLLLRDNRTLADCVAALRNAGINVSDEGLSQLEDSPAVLALLSLLRLADHPADRVSLFLATRKPLADIIGVEQMELVDSWRLADELSARVRREVADEGLAEWIGRMSNALAPHCAPRDIGRLEQLRMAAAEAEPSTRPDEFVRSLEGKSIAAGSTDLVRALTLHGCKGLEFDEVILPLYDSSGGRGAKPWNRLRSSCVGPVIAMAPQPPDDLLRHMPALGAMANERRLAQWLDDISLLYVGLTRPRTALHVLLADTSEEPPSWNTAAFFKFALPDVATELRAKGVWEYREGVLDGELPPSATPAPEPTTVARPAPLPTYRAEAPACVGSARAVAAQWAKWQAEPTSVGDEQAMARGTLVHSLLQRLVWAENGAPEGTAAEEQVAALVERQLAARGETWKALSRAAVPGGNEPGIELQVRTEVPILMGDDDAESGRIDRLVIATKAGRPVWAQIIDFKTGEVPPEDELRHVSLPAYREQVRGYMSAVAAALGLELSKVTGALLFIEPDTLVEVQHE